jgi:UDP-glucose 4-epimerase
MLQRGDLIANCLIVGGGFLGGHLADRLARDGHRVTVYSRSFSEWLTREERGPSGSIRLIEGELPPGAALREVIAAADVVFYMAGASTPASASRDPGGSMARHVVPAAAVLDLMRETPTRRVVVASSGGTVYGAADVLPTPEDHPARPISLHGHHSLTIERYARFFAEQYRFETVILRYSNAYGPGQLARRGQGVIAAWSSALARGEPLVVFGDPETRRDFIFIDDLVEATARAGLLADPGIYNVGSGEATPLREVLEIVRAVAQKKNVDIIHRNARGIDLPATQLDYSKLAASVGWRPAVGLTDGITASWEWISTLPYDRSD